MIAKKFDFFLKFKIFRFIFEFFRRFTKHDILGMAAKAAYYLLISFFPLSILLISVIAANGAAMFEYIMPASVLVILEDILKIKPQRGLTIISIIITIWSASRSIWALMNGIYVIHTGHQRGRLKKGRIRAFFYVILLAAATVTLVSLTFISTYAEALFAEYFSGITLPLIKIGRIAAVIGIMFCFSASLYIITPGVEVKIRDVFIGSLVTSIGWVGATLAFEIYMKMFNNYSLLYGSIGAFLGLALWLFIVTIVLFCGAELNEMLRGARKKL